MFHVLTSMCELTEMCASAITNHQTCLWRNFVEMDDSSSSVMAPKGVTPRRQHSDVSGREGAERIESKSEIQAISNGRYVAI